MQIGEKKSALDDDSALYSHKTDNMTEKEKFRALKGKKKWIYFRDYYLLKIIAVVAILAFVASLAYNIFKPKTEMVFYAAVGDGAVPYSCIDDLTEKFGEYIAIDKEKQEICFDTTYSFATDSYNAYQKFAVYLAVGQIDVTIVPKSVFDSMVVNSYFKPMSEVLPTDLYLELSDKLVISAVNDDDGNLIPDSERAYGLIIDDASIYNGMEYSEPNVLAVCANTKKPTVCVDFIEFLLK